MEITTENRSVIREIIADFVSSKRLMSKELCEEKMTTVENMEESMKSLDRKLWAIILILLTIAGGLVVSGFAS